MPDEFKALQELCLVSPQMENYDMTRKKLTNVGTPTVNTDAATKKYVDETQMNQPRNNTRTFTFFTEMDPTQ